MKAAIRQDLERILLPSDILEGHMQGITKAEAEQARKEGREMKHVLQECLYFIYCRVDFYILLDDKVIMADEKTFSYPFNKPEEVANIVKWFVRSKGAVPV